jgi:hypothetical protein
MTAWRNVNQEIPGTNLIWPYRDHYSCQSPGTPMRMLELKGGATPEKRGEKMPGETQGDISPLVHS